MCTLVMLLQVLPHPQDPNYRQLMLKLGLVIDFDCFAD